MSNSAKVKTKRNMDKTDIAYIIELLDNALSDMDWDAILEAKEFLKECVEDDGGPIELEE
jgi:hypothetical protein